MDDRLQGILTVLRTRHEFFNYLIMHLLQGWLHLINHISCNEFYHTFMWWEIFQYLKYYFLKKFYITKRKRNKKTFSYNEIIQRNTSKSPSQPRGTSSGVDGEISCNSLCGVMVSFSIAVTKYLERISLRKERFILVHSHVGKSYWELLTSHQEGDECRLLLSSLYSIQFRNPARVDGSPHLN